MSRYGFPVRRHHHILNAASNLLGIALIIVTSLHLTHIADQTVASKIAWFAAVMLAFSVLLSYTSIRLEPNGDRFENWADRTFLTGTVALVSAVSFLAVMRL
jgi:hypothetical protein